MSSKKTSSSLGLWQALMLAGLFVFWHVATEPALLPPIYFDKIGRASCRERV